MNTKLKYLENTANSLNYNVDLEQPGDGGQMISVSPSQQKPFEELAKLPVNSDICGRGWIALFLV